MSETPGIDSPQTGSRQSGPLTSGVLPGLRRHFTPSGVAQGGDHPHRRGIGLGLLGLAFGLLLWLAAPPAAWAASLSVSEVHLEPCPSADVGSQAGRRGPGGASCYALRGVVENPGRRPVVDTDVFALILDASGEPVLPNRSRVGTIGDIPPGRSSFALRLAVPAGTPGPFQVSNVRARGFSAPVRSRARDGDELLPLEQLLIPGDDLPQ